MITFFEFYIEHEIKSHWGHTQGFLYAPPFLHVNLIPDVVVRVRNHFI
jgi:hypothetical protein